MYLTDYLREKLVDHLFGTPYSPPTTIYCGLGKDWFRIHRKSADGSISEYTDADDENYRRSEISFTLETGPKIVQDRVAFFPPTSGGALSHGYYCIVDAETGGNHLALGWFTDADAYVLDEYMVITKRIFYKYERWNDWGIALSGIEFSRIEENIRYVSSGFITNYAYFSLLSLVFLSSGFSSPDTYLALLADNPTNLSIEDASDLTEVSGTGYERKQVNPVGGASPAWNPSNRGTMTNAHDVVWNVNGSDWTDITGIALVSSVATDAKVFAVFPYEKRILPISGKKVRLPSETLRLSL